MKYLIPESTSRPTPKSTSNSTSNFASNSTSNSDRSRAKGAPTKKPNNRRIKIGLDPIDSDTLITVSIDPTNTSYDENGSKYADRELKVRGHVKRDDLYDQHQLREKGPDVFMLDSCYSHKIAHLERTLRTTLDETREQRDSKFSSLTYEQRTERWRTLLWRIARTDKMPEGKLDHDYPVRIVGASEVRRLREMGYHEFSALLSTRTKHDSRTEATASSTSHASSHSQDGSDTFGPQLKREVKKEGSRGPTTDF